MSSSLVRGVLAALVALVAAAAIAACGSSKSSSGSGSSNSSTSGAKANTGTSGSGSSGPKAAIPIGQVGAYTGQIPGLAGQGQGLTAWVNLTNAAGGIDGHKIKLYTADTQGNPTNEVSDTTQLESQHKVVAFAGMGLTTVAGVAKTLYSQHIPVIGGNTNDVAFAINPGFYDPGSGFIATYMGGFLAVPKGHTKTGIVYCSESSGCIGVYDLMFKDGLSKVNGGDPVYSAEAALTAPSFTAQCLAAKQAGVQTLAVAFDPTNFLRLAKNCAAQGYHPLYAEGGTVANDAVATSGLTNGTVSGQSQAPWFLTSGPIEQMKQAMAKYEPKDSVDSTTVEGWSAGVALGAAIQDYYKAHPSANTLTGQDIMDGLGMIKNDTFGGLTPPVSFTSSGVQKQSNCYFGIKVAGKKWAEESSKPICTPASADGPMAKALKALSSSS